MKTEELAKIQERYTLVGRDELKAKLLKNRNKHKKEYEIAIKGWRMDHEEQLRLYARKCLTIADQIKSEDFPLEEIKWPTFPHLSKPSDHSGDYDMIIEKMNMSQNEKIWLSDEDFSKFVMDDWSWKSQHKANFESYGSKLVGSQMK